MASTQVDRLGSIPLAPAGLTATAVDGGFTLTWTASSDGTIQTYQVSVAPGANQPISSAVAVSSFAAPATTTTFTPGYGPAPLSAFLQAIGTGGASAASGVQVTPLGGPNTTAWVTSYGADPTGVADSSAAFTSANSASLDVFMPPGTYSAHGFTPRVGTHLHGAGRDAVIINIPSNGTFAAISNGSLAEAKVTIDGFTLNGAGASTTGFSFTLTESVTLRDLRFSGLTTNAYFDRGRWPSIEDCISIGNASYASGQLTITSTSDSDYCFWPNVQNYQINCGQYDAGITQGSADPAIYTRRTIRGNITDATADGLQLGSGAKMLVIENDTQGMKVTRVTAEGATTGVLMQEGTGVAVAPGYCIIDNCDFDNFSTAGIQMNGGSYNTISKGEITWGSTHDVPGISLSSVIAPSVQEVQMVGNSTTLGTGVYCSGNVFGLNMGNCVFAGLLKVGLDVSTGTLANAVVTDNSFYDCSSNISGSPAGSGNRFSDNLGLASPNVTTPSFPASGTAVANNTGVDVMAYVTGGTITNVIVSLQTIGAVPGPYYIPATRGITFTYTGSPSWNWSGID